MKGEITHERTKYLLELCLAHAEAQFERSCGARLGAKCDIYGGSAWNQGTHLTVIIDRHRCADHASGPAMSDVEMWVYDISGESPMYMGKASRSENHALLKEPGDAGAPKSEGRPFLKH